MSGSSTTSAASASHNIFDNESTEEQIASRDHIRSCVMPAEPDDHGIRRTCLVFSYHGSADTSIQSSDRDNIYKPAFLDNKGFPTGHESASVYIKTSSCGFTFQKELMFVNSASTWLQLLEAV